MALKEFDATPEIRDNPALKDFNDLPSLAKSYIEQKAFVGSSIRPPGPDATPEAKKDFYDKLQKHAPHLVPLVEGDAAAEAAVWEKLGRPKDETGYEFKPPDDAPIDVNSLRVVAKTGGLTKAQFQKMAEATVAGTRKQLEATKADQAALKAEWGATYDQQLKDAAGVAVKFGADEKTVANIMKGSMGSKDLKLWAAIAKAVGTEPKKLGEGGSTPPGALTPAEAEAQFKELQKNPGYWSRNHPDHDRLVKRGHELQGMVVSG